MAATVITGTLGTGDVLAGKKVRDVTPGLQHKLKDISPVFRIFNMLPKGPTATNPKSEWTMQEDLPRWAYLTTAVAASTSAGATVTLIPAHTAAGSADTERFKVGDVVEVPAISDSGTTHTNIGVVTTVTTDTSIVVDPIGFASNDETTDLKFVATTAGSKIHVITDASSEYSTRPAMKVAKESQDFNYIGFKRAPYMIGNIQMDQKNYSGPERAQRKEETYRDIRIQADEDLIHGRRYFKSATDGRQYFMGGFKRYIKEGAGPNILSNWSAGLTEEQWDEYLITGPMKYGSGRRFLFASDQLFLKINSFAKAKERIVGNITLFGLQFTQYRSPNNKNIFIHQHYGLIEDYEGAGLIIDPENAELSGYGSQGTIRLLENAQENDRAGISDEWQTVFTLRVLRTEPHGWISA